MPSSSYLDVFRSRNLAVVLLLGFASGLPLALTSGTLQAWMTVEGVDLATIGIFTLVGLPYTWKFLWAPFMDRFTPPFLGRRRGWLLVTQLGLISGIFLMGSISPSNAAWTMALLAVFVAFASASQDIVLDAYRADILREKERGLGAAMSVLGYRLAMLTSGALVLIIVVGFSFWNFEIVGIGWQKAYWLMAGLMLIGVAATLWGREPDVAGGPPKSLEAAVVEPLKEFFSRSGAWWLLALIVLYKLGDAFAGSLSTAFLIRGIGFTPAEVGVVNKGMGLAATIVGVVFGGGLMIKLGLYRSLLIFGVLQALSNLTFMWLAIAGKSYPLMALAIGAENVTGGMGTAAFVALLMALCDHRFTATQYALLSALSAVGRVYAGPLAGYATDPKQWGLSWGVFYFLTFLAALPGLVLLLRMRPTIARLGNGNESKTKAEAGD
ncbi:MAG TPA: MFS transporter [Burkholderiales bacterium]|nr:MFS transporter [Burkholderiales bacterium]